MQSRPDMLDDPKIMEDIKKLRELVENLMNEYVKEAK